MAATGQALAESMMVSEDSSSAVSKKIALASLSKAQVLGATAIQDAAPMQRFLSMVTVSLPEWPIEFEDEIKKRALVARITQGSFRVMRKK